MRKDQPAPPDLEAIRERQSLPDLLCRAGLRGAAESRERQEADVRKARIEQQAQRAIRALQASREP